MEKRDQRESSDVFKRKQILAKTLNMIYPKAISLDNFGSVRFRDDVWKKQLYYVFEEIFEWSSYHETKFNYRAQKCHLKYGQTIEESANELFENNHHDISLPGIATYGSESRRMMYFQRRKELEPEERFWEIWHSGNFHGFNSCENPFVGNPKSLNFITDKPEEFMLFLHERTGWALHQAGGSAPWCTEGGVIHIYDDMNDLEVAITASSFNAFEDLPEPVFKD